MAASPTARGRGAARGDRWGGLRDDPSPPRPPGCGQHEFRGERPASEGARAVGAGNSDLRRPRLRRLCGLAERRCIYKVEEEKSDSHCNKTLRDFASRKIACFHFRRLQKSK
jgi:hypothetical protein